MADARRRALETGRTLTAVLEDALREALYRRPVQSDSTPPELPTFGTGGTRPGVDLDGSASLDDLMNGVA